MIYDERSRYDNVFVATNKSIILFSKTLLENFSVTHICSVIYRKYYKSVVKELGFQIYS